MARCTKAMFTAVAAALLIVFSAPTVKAEVKFLVTACTVSPKRRVSQGG